MENSQTNQIDQPDIRQAPQWAECLSLYGWKSIKTSSGIDMEVLNNPLGGFIKVQKPNNITKSDLEEVERIAREKKTQLMIVEPSLTQDMPLLYDNGFVKSNFFLTPVKTIVLDLEK